MNAGQRRQLSTVGALVFAQLGELSPRVIEPSKEKQKELGVADATMLFRVGSFRVITVFPIETNSWNLKEFDSESGELVRLSDETAPVLEAEVPAWVLRAVIASIESQLAGYASDGHPSEAHEESAAVIARLLPKLQQRLVTASGKVNVGTVSDTDDDYFG